MTKQSKSILENGHIYAYGHDNDFSPVIYLTCIDLNTYDSEDYLNAIYQLCNPLEQHMLVPGIIEQWTVVINCKKPNDIDYSSLIALYPMRLKQVFALVKGWGIELSEVKTLDHYIPKQ